MLERGCAPGVRSVQGWPPAAVQRVPREDGRLLTAGVSRRFLWLHWQLPEAEFSLNAFKYDVDIASQMQLMDLFLSVMINTPERSICHKVV